MAILAASCAVAACGSRSALLDEAVRPESTPPDSSPDTTVPEPVVPETSSVEDTTLDTATIDTTTIDTARADTSLVMDTFVDETVSTDEAAVDSSVADVVVLSDAPATITPCLTGGNVFYYTESVLGAWLTPTGGPVTDAKWDIQYALFGKPGPLSKRYLEFAITTATRYWTLTFSSEKLGTPLDVGPYEDAARSPFEAKGQPGLDLTDGAKGCDEVFGRFEISEITWTDTALKSLTATFDLRCDYLPNITHGCVHFGP